MLLPTIYKRTQANKVQEWAIEVVGSQYRTVVGQQNGKKVESKWTTCKGKNIGKKNATSPEEQAMKEAEANRRLKLEAEYRENIADIDNADIPKEPLLAEKFFDEKRKKNKEVVLTYPVWSQPKLDGMRCIVKSGVALSRENNPVVVVVHIVEELAEIFEEFPELKTDGELYNHTLKDDFDTLISIARKGKATPERLADAKEKIQYWIYDIQDTTKSFEERQAFIREMLVKLKAKNPNHPIVHVETTQVNNREELDALYTKYLEDGYEGQMIRTNDVYEFSRSWSLLKRKEFIDEEFEILDILEGDGNRSEMAGKMCFIKDGKPFEANMRGNAKKYKEWLTNKTKYIGLKATVRYQNLTPEGKPRFPVVIAVRDYE